MKKATNNEITEKLVEFRLIARRERDHLKELELLYQESLECIRFIEDTVIDKLLPFDFLGICVGFKPLARIVDNKDGRLGLKITEFVSLDHGQRIVLTDQGWSYKSRDFDGVTNIFRTVEFIEESEIYRFCENFTRDYNINLEVAVYRSESCGILSSAVGWFNA